MQKKMTKYNGSWENEFSFIKPGPTEHEAHCLDCDHNFPISNGGKMTLKNILIVKCIRKT